MHASPDGSHDQTYSEPTEPRWHDDPNEWADTINHIHSLADAEREREGGTEREDLKLGKHAVAVATMVFYAAAQHNTGFMHPHPFVVETWAQIYENYAPWITVSIAEAAVDAHFATSQDGHMLPAHVIAEAKKLTGRD